jgi:anti-anti-sigma regulatory factor
MKKVNIHTSPMQIDDTTIGEVFMEGDLTVRNVSAIQSKLLEALQNHQAAKISVQNVTAIDLSCIQLLYSAIKTSEEMKKHVDMDIQLPAEFESLLTKAGFESLIKRFDK